MKVLVRPKRLGPEPSLVSLRRLPVCGLRCGVGWRRHGVAVTILPFEDGNLWRRKSCVP